MKKNNKQLYWINKVYSVSKGLIPLDIFTKTSSEVNNKILLNKEIINIQVNNFFNEIISNIEDLNNKYILILFRVQFTNNDISTIGSLQKFNLDKDINYYKNNYINYLNELLNYKDDHYKTEHIKSIIFSYIINDGKIDTSLDIINKKDTINEKNDFLTYYQYKLPIAFNPMDYDDVIKVTNYDYIVPLFNRNTIKIKLINKTSTKCTLYSKNQLILEYKDTKIDENTFVRKINKNKYTFVLGKLELMESVKKSKFINPIINKGNTFNFLTLDIETYLNKDNYQIPYCICIYDGKEDKVFKFYLDEFKSSEDMLITAINSICKWKYNSYNVYAHNFSNFDGIFLLKILNKIGIINPTIKDGKIISVNFIFKSEGNKSYSLNFFDSILLLQSSLRKLGKSFNVSTQKGNFDTTTVNLSNYLILKDEIINYCIDDCKSLYQILIKFNQLINENFNINIKNYPTIPSLTFANFRTNYLQENQIAQISGKIYEDMRKSYTGGSTEMYIPYNNTNELLYYYDANSLYPYVMKECDFPIGTPTYFEGDIRKINKDAFGIFYCEIKTREYLEHPIIQTHVKTNNGIRTLSPLGNWFDWLCSPEIDNAINFGYEFKIIKGYTFEKSKIFSSFIDKLYNLRLNYLKSDPMNYIAKLFMNSLYGRFGMNDNFNEIRIVNKDLLDKLTLDNNIIIKDILNFDDDYIIQILKNNDQEINSLINNLNENHNINIAIASFVTSYSRKFMSQFKNNDIKLFYTDTDSIIVNKPLPDYLVDNKILGKMKLEYISQKGIFLAPKLYCLLTDENIIINKTRGLTHDIQLNIQDFENLLYKDSEIIKNQNKWFKDIYKGTIKIDELPYSVKYTDNKRKLIFENGKLIGTKPFTINSNKEII